MDELNLAAISMTTTHEKSRNVETALAYVRQAAKAGAHWVQLPEMYAFQGPQDQIFAHAEAEDGPLNQSVGALARELGIVIIAGSVGEQSSESKSKVYNTTYVFGRDGSILCKYRKIHLFSLRDAQGQLTHSEPSSYLSGHQAVALTIDGWRLGLTICYDLRFPELFLKLAKPPVDIFAVPSAFTLNTGMYHWELLLRARAVENLCYVYAANQCGTHHAGKNSYGHSMIVDPWGHKIADSGHFPGVSMATVRKSTLEKYRSQLPALSNKRDDIYHA